MRLLLLVKMVQLYLAPSAVVTKSDADEKHSHTGDDGATTVGEDGSVIPGTPVQKTHSQTFSLLSEDSLVGSITSTVSDYSTVTAGPSAIVTNPDADEEYGQHKDDEVTTVGEDGAVIPGTPIQKNYGQFDYLLSKAQTAAKTYTVSGASARTRASTSRIISAVVKRNVDEDGDFYPVQKDHSQDEGFRRQAASVKSSSSSNAASGLQISLGLGALSAVVLSLL
ncbi:unnamed protein product [Ambrosiozyma monospora]|uniref:Unnamed protein product n=1 Tax=Ambrosiozyma monospora TaxID=43982 RepID=A0ACB5TUX0_AMBMO|nr:unnamed protein product [Ambrosiozyma monospora]